MENLEQAANEVIFTDGSAQDTTNTVEVTNGVENVDKTVEVATPQNKSVEVKEDGEVQAADKTETQRVAQRIKEATEKAKQEALESHKGIKLIEKLAKQNKMTVDEYITAVEEQEEQAKIRELAEQNGIPEEFAKKFAELEKKTTTLEMTQKEYEKKKSEQKEFDEFYTFFKEDTEKTLTDIEMIPAEVYQIKEKTGKTLTDSYITYKYNELKKAQNIIKANTENTATAAGSISKQIDKQDDFISYSEFEKNKSDRNWVTKNLSKITNSRKKW